ncbi:MAG TPA: choice-of-anchor D domain-containing protein, partial [Candidatus Aquilonibacter sp.]|nr:choice-of-anchor D domain-containing protein [Candidatus Aquilonibacter sp.]
SLNFGSQTVGTSSEPQVVTAINEGGAAITFASIGLSDRKDFSETDDCAGQTIQPGAGCAVSVTFQPTKSGGISGKLYLNLPLDSVSPVPVALWGAGT